MNQDGGASSVILKLIKEKNPDVLIDEKELMFGILRNDPRILSHVWGAQVYHLHGIQKNKSAAYQRFDEILAKACELFYHDADSLSRVIRTIFISYDYDSPSVTRLHNFDQFQAIAGRYILNRNFLNPIRVFK